MSRVLAPQSVSEGWLPSRCQVRTGGASSEGGRCFVEPHGPFSHSCNPTEVYPRAHGLDAPARRPSPRLRCRAGQGWAFVHSKQLQATHCREEPTYTGRRYSPRDDGTYWRVELSQPP